MVPAFAVLVFLIFGNHRRNILMRSLPLISFAFIFLVASPAALVSALALILPPFAFKEILIRRNAKPLFWLFLLYILFSFAVLKNYFGFGQNMVSSVNMAGLSPLLESIGLSFIIFRSVEYLIVSPVGIIGRGVKISDLPLFRATLARFWKYLGFCLAYPSFTSGPITRWRGYSNDYEGGSPVFENDDDLKNQIRRIANGFVKISLLSQPLLLLMLGFATIIDTFAQTNIHYFIFVLLAAIIYLYFLFINFSAFTDVMIGSGRFTGLKLPENFDRPFSSKNFLDFWSHWHLSVSLWFRDLSFTPIVKYFVLKGIRSNFLCSAVAYFVTFGMLGLWHGRTWPFILCGLLLAFGALYNQIYREFLAAHIKSILGDTTFISKLWTQAGRSLTYAYIAIAIMGLWLGGESMAIFWKNLFSLQGGLALLVIIVVFTCVLTGFDSLLSKLPSPFKASVIRTIWETNHISVSAAKLVLSVILWLWLNVDEGGFVYEGF